MSDKEFVKRIAQLWVELGGDDEGVDWLIDELKEAIRKEIKK